MQACIATNIKTPTIEIEPKIKKGNVQPVKTEALLIQKNDISTKKNIKQAERIAKIGKNQGNKKTSYTNFVNDAWLGDETIMLSSGQANMPKSLANLNNLTFITPSMSLPQIADTLSKMVAIPIQIINGNHHLLKLIKKKNVRFNKGYLPNLLDLIATNFDAIWGYDHQKHRIIFTRVLTMELDFFVAAGAEQFIKKISTQNNANNSFTANRTVVSDPWQELKGDLERILPKGSQISLSPTSGKIVLTSTPSAMRDAVKLVRKRNKILQWQLYFNVQLLELKISEDKFKDNNLPLSLSALLSQASEGKLLVNGKKPSVRAAKPDGSKVEALIKTPESAQKLNDKNVIDTLLRALDSIGDISVLTSTNSWTRNGKAISVRNVLQQSYVAQVKDNVLVPAQLETSFYLHLMPLILPNDKVQIDLSVSLKSLNEMRNYGTGGNQIQLPQLSSKSWNQEAIIPNSATLLISGFEVRRAANGEHTIMIILITPQILEHKI